MWKLHVSLEPLWQELSECIGVTESQLGQGSLSSVVVKANVGDPSLPLGNQRLLPFIEAFVVLCDKLQENRSLLQQDIACASESKIKQSITSSSQSHTTQGTMTFPKFTYPTSKCFCQTRSWLVGKVSFDIAKSTMDADKEKHILYEKTKVFTEETKHEYVDLVADYKLSAIRSQINSFLESFSELIPWELISIFNDKELELLNNGLPEINLNDLQANTKYIHISFQCRYVVLGEVALLNIFIIELICYDRYIQRGQPDAGFPLIESESLMWPGSVEFDNVNWKMLTYSAQDG
nr:E3 ubiquitin-protein ligase UPL1-like isoform X1 [Tanacetum cinerariifolium]